MDDWIYFKKVGYVHSIIEDDESVHFITNNGIYSYNDLEDYYYYNFELSNTIDFSEPINYFYFDPSTNMYWLIDNYSIKMKHSFHVFWNELAFRKLNIISVNEIVDIGRSSNYVWIKLFDRIIPLNQITGDVITDDIDRSEINNIEWSLESYNNNIDLTDFVIFDEVHHLGLQFFLFLVLLTQIKVLV